MSFSPSSLVQYWSPVVPSWTPTVLPFRSVREVMSLSFVTMIAWEASKYGSEKSTFFLRSSLAVIPAATMSALPDCNAVINVSNAMSLTSSSTPSLSAIFWEISMSMPTTSSPSLYSNGSNSALVAMYSVPAFWMSSGVLTLLPQADIGTIMDTARRNAKIFFPVFINRTPKFVTKIFSHSIA